MQRRSGPRKEPHAPVLWEEVWQWCEDIEKRWGYTVRVEISPPLRSQRNARFVVAVTGKKLSINSNQQGSTVTRWLSVVNEAVTAETIAMQLVIDLHCKLDREEYEAERAALASGALL